MPALILPGGGIDFECTIEARAKTYWPLEHEEMLK